MGEMDDRGRSECFDGLFRTVSHDLIDLMAYFKMVTETKHLLGRCEGEDVILVDGSDLKLRLEILAIYELLENALYVQERAHPSKPFETLLEMFDSLCIRASYKEQSIVAEKWPEMRTRLVRQAPLSVIRSQEREHQGPGPFDWSTISTDEYIATVDRLIPPVDEDMDALHDEKKITAAKERRNLKDIFLEKRGGVHGCKVLALLRENKLAIFEKDMAVFAKELESTILPLPKIIQLYKNSGFLDQGMDEMEDANGHDVDVWESPRKRAASKRADGSPKRKRGDDLGPASALALVKANESLQREMRGHSSHPGTVAEALALGESVLDSRSPGRKRTTVGTDRGEAAGERSTSTSTSRSRSGESKKRPKYITAQNSPGEQVSFDDSQSIDEPQAFPRTLQNHLTPPKGPVLHSTDGSASKKAVPRNRARVPWTEEEVMHLNAAVKALGKGKWALALSQYKFQGCRTSVDLKDKWRNLTKDKD